MSAPVRINVQEVALGKPLAQLSTGAVSEAWKKATKVMPIAESRPPPSAVATFEKNNLLALAVHMAFYGHFPLVLSPDVVWITIAQGFAYHVDFNAEALRSRFVKHDGQQDIVVVRPDIKKEDPNADWSGLVSDFAGALAPHLGAETCALVESNFSTTTAIDRVVSQITLLSAVKSYFHYVAYMGCGIPYVELRGTADDWRSIRERAEKLRGFDLEWWIDELLPVLDAFVATAEGRGDPLFWKSICNLVGASGISRPITGWIQTFFPYVLNGRATNERNAMMKNKYLGEWKTSLAGDGHKNLKVEIGGRDGVGEGVELEIIPSGISCAPFVLKDLRTGESSNMKFCGGLTCIVQDPTTLAVEVVTGWAIMDADK